MLLKKKFSVKIISAAFLLSGFFTTTVSADTTINFSGNLIVPDCTINSGNAIDVPFGDIIIQDLAAVNQPYKMTPIPIDMNCPYTSGTPKLTVMATPATGAVNNDAIVTSKDTEGFVVYLYQADQTSRLQLNTPTEITITGTAPALHFDLFGAVGHLNGVSQLTAGAFTSTASIRVTYP
jgi:minor pilin subunit PapE